MESLISWGLKVEPLSPELPNLDSEAGAWLFENDLEGVLPDFDPESGEWLFEGNLVTQSTLNYEKTTQPTRAELASKLLEDLNLIKEEPFSDWLEEKIDLPIFEELPSVEARLPGPAKWPVQADTDTLLQEFESVFGAVEMNNGTLTPPQSPTLFPRSMKSEELMITTLQQMVPLQATPLAQLPAVKVIEQMVPAGDLDQEMAAVEELIATRVEDLVQPSPWGLVIESAPNQVDTNVSCNIQVGPSELCNLQLDSGSSCSSQQDSESEMSSATPPSPCASSNSSFTGPEDDPDWIPVSVRSPDTKAASGSRRRSSKPYSRPVVEEKRMRKKEQNKNAATRYRQKKKAEIEEILSEEKGLENKNTGLQNQVSDLEREIKYLKGLMRDLFKAKGLLK